MTLALSTVEQQLQPLVAAGTLGKVFSGIALADPKWRPQGHELPAVFLLPGGDRAQPSPVVSGRHRQRVEQLLRVVIAFEVEGGRYSVADGAEVEQLLRALRDRLVAWQPDVRLDPLDLVSGRTVALRDRLVWWEEVYRSAYQRTAS
ncbi:phage tail terminator protein [Algihabitans albus]|uniref:phage tail terminator protein n=1 Tax=Algihabitans albus TaxID=2164067 RepID=UPI000E5CFB2F|nr:hypothetical protein [Algihabitans albus]